MPDFRARQTVLAIDMGGTRLRVALIDDGGNVLERAVEPTRSEEGPDSVAQRIRATARQLLDKKGLSRPVAVGAGVASPLDLNGVLYHPPHLTGWGVVPFKALLEKQLDMPVFMANDASVAALGEHMFGQGKGIDDLVYLTVSTGVGGGVIAGGLLLLGARGLAGELGHIIIDRNGPVADCGHHGCLESLASGTSIARDAAAALRTGRVSAIAGLAGGAGAVRAEHVFQAAAQGDALAREIVDEVGRNLGLGIVSLLHTFNPKKMILGGGVTQNWDMLKGNVDDVLRRVAMPGFLDGFELSLSRMGDDVGLIGAAAYALQEVKRRAEVPGGRSSSARRS